MTRPTNIDYRDAPWILQLLRHAYKKNNENLQRQILKGLLKIGLFSNMIDLKDKCQRAYLKDFEVALSEIKEEKEISKQSKK